MAPTATAPGTHRVTASGSHAVHVPVLSNFIGGMWVDARASGTVDVFNPATGAVIAKTPLSTRGDVDAAVAAAKAAFPAWRATPVVERARDHVAFKNRLEEHFEELARIVTTEHGKTLDEARGSVRRGIECVEVACGMPSLMMGSGLEDIARGIDCDVHRQPLGVFGAIAPFNFPAMVPLWFPAVRGRDGKHVRPEAVGARAALPEAHPRAPRGLHPSRRREHRERRRRRRERPLRASRRRASPSWARRPSPGTSTARERTRESACRPSAARRTSSS